MSKNDEILTDDYVADLLAQEASDCSLKYSAMGMEAYRTNKKPANMMKPNTRFLRHIIKDTDNHNKALLAKEAAESKARLKDLERTEEIKRRKTNPSVHDIRRRQMGDIHAILGGKKRPRNEDEAGPSSRRNSQHGRIGHEEITDGAIDHGAETELPKKKGIIVAVINGETGLDHLQADDGLDRPGNLGEEEEEGSDAMEDLMGPAPPPKYRGRGTVGGSSGIDRRFSDTYDPKTDIQMDEDEVGNDWDDAVEAFRDRQKLRQNQEQRLKDAGFADEQIQRASGADEKSAESVQWSKAGEKRAWDVGKVIGSDGVAQPEV
ncbi:hypothetical protein AU210_009344 [Fusarium oxysporum f. sp. radicis-cucumerinum]|uniref:Pre-mRNA-splicing factor 38B n=1 Tax=Fusarium oxysporum f. sp. radicis-cucumerinum TaxID=327505 RepID=A0A2H3H6R9_FUSOX|nr:hypothetical protein AU210_009344 [Fusarium oxysporum f. sp. radicis-cucumerinum]